MNNDNGIPREKPAGNAGLWTGAHGELIAKQGLYPYLYTLESFEIGREIDLLGEAGG